jgi:hypothetical protein
MATHDLTELMFDTDLSEPLRLYVYRPDGYHTGGMWFRRRPKYPEEEITAADAKQRAEKAIAEGLEVRITNGDDFLVFHAIGGKVEHPADAEAFWRAVAP